MNFIYGWYDKENDGIRDFVWSSSNSLIEIKTDINIDDIELYIGSPIDTEIKIFNNDGTFQILKIKSGWHFYTVKFNKFLKFIGTPIKFDKKLKENRDLMLMFGGIKLSDKKNYCDDLNTKQNEEVIFKFNISKNENVNSKNVLIGVPVKNCGAWLENTVHQIINLDYNKENISIVFIENDSDDYSFNVIEYCVNKLLSKYKYKAINYEKKDTGFKLPHQSRHDLKHISNRMNSLKIVRNYIVDNYLLDNDFIWWVDADYKFIPNTLLRNAIDFDKDIIMPRVEVNGVNYDEWTCGYVGGKIFKIKEISSMISDEIYPMEIVECAAVISRRVFDAGIRYDSGWVTQQTGDKLYLQEGTHFAYHAKKSGFQLYGLLKHVIIHQDVIGTIPFDS